MEWICTSESVSGNIRLQQFAKLAIGRLCRSMAHLADLPIWELFPHGADDFARALDENRPGHPIEYLRSLEGGDQCVHLLLWWIVNFLVGEYKLIHVFILLGKMTRTFELGTEAHQLRRFECQLRHFVGALPIRLGVQYAAVL